MFFSSNNILFTWKDFMEMATVGTSQDPCSNVNQWADLPKDVLFRIIQFLDLKTDLYRVRAVCPSWRSALPLAEVPVLQPCIEVPSLGDNDNQPLFLLETRFYFILPLPSSLAADNCEGWLTRMSEIGTNKWHLLNPFNNQGYFEANYCFNTEPPITGEINLLDCRVLELARPMSLVRRSNYGAKTISKVISRKVVGGWDLTSSHLFAVLVQLEKEEGGNLLFWSLGKQEWCKIVAEENNTSTVSVVDIAFHNNKFYSLEFISRHQWRVRVINQGYSEQFISGPDIMLPDRSLLLVGVDGCEYALSGLNLVSSKSNGSPYVVIEAIGNVRKLCNMFVFSMNEDNKWYRVEKLEDEIFFIGNYVSFALPSSAHNLPHWKSSSICSFIVTDSFCKCRIPVGVECLKYVSYPFYNRYCSLFVMEEKEKGALPSNEMPKEDEELYTGLFFPPPAWVKWHCPSLSNAEVRLDGLQLRGPYADTDDDDDD